MTPYEQSLLEDIRRAFNYTQRLVHNRELLMRKCPDIVDCINHLDTNIQQLETEANKKGPD